MEADLHHVAMVEHWVTTVIGSLDGKCVDIT